MRTGDAFRLAQPWDTDTSIRTANTPLGQVAVEDGTVDGQESGKVFTHPYDLGGSVNELLDRGNAIVRNIALCTCQLNQTFFDIRTTISN